MAAKCRVCIKTVYPMDPQINLDGVKFHKSCAKCQDCNCQITISNFTKDVTANSTVLLCKTHYFKRFHEGGSYLGGEKFAVKATRDIQAKEKGRVITPDSCSTISQVHHEHAPVSVFVSTSVPKQAEVTTPTPVKASSTTTSFADVSVPPSSAVNVTVEQSEFTAEPSITESSDVIKSAEVDPSSELSTTSESASATEQSQSSVDAVTPEVVEDLKEATTTESAVEISPSEPVAE